MCIAYTRWPEQFAARYRLKGYWQDLPLTHIVTRYASNQSIAIVDRERHFSYQQFNQSIDNLAAYLQYKGAKCGETALVQLGNVAEFYIVFFALLRIGVVPVNALYSHQSHELNAYAQQINPTLFIADRLHSLFVDDGFLTTFCARYSSVRLVLLNNDTGARSLNNMIRQTHYQVIATPTPADEVAFFQLSGGSTGTPKLIPRTHNDYLYSVRRCQEICQLNRHTCYLCVLPSAHNFCLSSPGALGVFMAGGCVVLANNPSPDHCFKLIEQHGVNISAVVPSIVNLWLQALRERGGHKQLSSLRLLQVGGASLTSLLAKRITGEMNCQLQQVFGMAEGLVCCTRLDDTLDKITQTQGYPICPDDELWVANEQGEKLASGEMGHLMTRGPYTIRGYFNSIEHNQETFDHEGFYYSGDLVSISIDGYLTVHGRVKDQINRGGEKIAAEEIENLLLQHNAITQAALVSVEHDVLGEKSCAYLVTTTPLRAVEIRRFLNQQGIAKYKLPDFIKFIKALPLTAVGKVDKRKLREWLIN